MTIIIDLAVVGIVRQLTYRLFSGRFPGGSRRGAAGGWLRCHSLVLLTASRRDTAPSLTKIFRRCRLTVASVSCRRDAIWPLLSACATRSSTSSSRPDNVAGDGPGRMYPSTAAALR